MDTIRYPINGTLLTDLKCPNRDELVSVKDGLVTLLNIDNICSYECIEWNTDFSYQLTKPVSLVKSQPVPCSYFIVTCKKNFSFEKKQIVFSPLKSEKLIKESMKLLENKEKQHDVIIIGIDSMSYAAYQYYLPKTLAAFRHSLNGITFKKFNTMGDGTTVNLQGFLTGTKDTETYEVRRRIANSKTVDNFNWIWKRFKENGYITLYAEDMTDYGTFQYRLNGFEKQPTDFYLRTPFIVAEQKGYYKNFCMDNKPMHSMYFKFFNEFQETYKDIPKFSFVFFGSMSHDDNKYISYIDNDLSKFITNLRKDNPSSFIILYSDHGHRFTSRLSLEGKYEERLPFLGISLPKTQESVMPILLKNSDILISGLDLHATLEDIIGIYNPTIRSRHMSLLRPLPNDRSCNDIESLPHWCSCLNWKLIPKPNSDLALVNVADSVVNRISEFTKFDRDLCAELKLHTLVVVYRLDANHAVLQFKQSADVDGFVPDMSDNLKQTAHLYRMTLRTTPGDALFDITISVQKDKDSKKKSFISIFRPEDVSRINKYAPWVKCLKNRSSKLSLISDIRKFCICKDVL